MQHTSQTPAGDPYLLRDATAADLDEIMVLFSAAFNGTPDPAETEIERLVFEPDRDHVVVRDGRIVANLGAYTRELTVPGAVLPAAHVTLAAVRPEHRRRGLLTRMIKHQFQVAPEPVAVLWASEGRIYQRFGYGMAASNATMEIESRAVSVAVGPAAAGSAAGSAAGELRDADPAEVRADLQRVYDQVRRDRPGWSSRDERGWDLVFADSPVRRRNASARRLTVHHGPDGIDGYAVWRARQEWANGGPDGEVLIQEVVTADPVAYAALWRHLITLDLTNHAWAQFVAPDEPLRYLVDEPRRLRMRVRDGLWLRLLDVAAALAGRRYPTAVDVTIEVTDPVLPHNSGRYRLRAEAGGPAECRRTTGPADLACDVATLATVYLGGCPLTRLADAGRVRELTPGALAAASPAFGWHRLPTPMEIF